MIATILLVIPYADMEVQGDLLLYAAGQALQQRSAVSDSTQQVAFLSHWSAGLNPMSWPLPLSRDGLRQAAQNPVSQPMPSAAKRAAEEAKLPVSLIASQALCLRSAACKATQYAVLIAGPL